jgi:signal transduction histidine kinase
MLSQFKSWVGQVPIEDPVDRRSALFMQWLLLFEGLRIPLNKAYLVWFHWPYLESHFYSKARSGEAAAIAIDFGTDLAMSISAWLGIYLIRSGHFRVAASIFLATVLCSGAVAYTAFGYQATDGNLTFIMILALSGMMLGRRALWVTYLGEAITLIISVEPIKITTSLHLPPVIIDAYNLLPMRALMSYFLITVIFDRSINALRASLDEANQHRKQLSLEIAAREHTQEQLLHSQKMDAMGKLASGIAHDMNNVFAIILGFSVERDRLDEEGSLVDDDIRTISEAMEGIEVAARRGTAVCRKLLAFSRDDGSHWEVFDMVAALREIRPLLRQLFPSSVQVRSDLPDTAIRICFDRSQFELAVFNLASNARDAMPNGGICTVAVVPSEGRVALSVTDTGIGMPATVIARIFEPFFTTKAVGDGTGLGLSVVDGLVRRAGGEIKVQSAPGAGTTIRLELPVAESDQVTADLMQRGSWQSVPAGHANAVFVQES